MNKENECETCIYCECIIMDWCTIKVNHLTNEVTKSRKDEPILHCRYFDSLTPVARHRNIGCPICINKEEYKYEKEMEEEVRGETNGE